MSTTTRVSVSPNLTENASRPAAPWRVRWRVGGRDRERSFATKPAARKYQTRLLSAADAREPFDMASGEPVSWSGRTGTPTCFELAVSLCARQFATPGRAASSNRGTVEGLATCLPALVGDRVQTSRHPRHVLESALQAHLNPHDTRQLSSAEHAALMWVADHSARVSEVSTAALERALNLAATKQDGTPGARSVLTRKRAAVSALFTHAIHGGHIDISPLRRLPRDVRAQEETVVPIDPAEVVTLASALDLVNRVRHAGHRLGLLIMLLAGLRPGEVAALRVRDVELPTGGRPLLRLRGSSTETRKRWAGGRTRDERGLKRRRAGAIRTVPIPHQLAVLLAAAVEGRAADTRVCASRSGTPFTTSNVAKSYKRAREEWAAAQPVSPSAVTMAVPYHLRHACATLWLSVMPVEEVAARLGNTPAVVLATYANVVPERGEHYTRAVEALIEDELGV